MMRHKRSVLLQSINDLQLEVETQRRQLDTLAIGREYHEDEPADETIVVESTITDEMIAKEEEEIRRLELLIEAKQRR